MCGIIVMNVKEFTESNLVVLKNVFIQSKIRGLHSTGFSFIHENKIETFHFNKPADRVMESFDFSKLLGIKNFKIIGHVRYSTSDIKYPQPIADDEYSIVHNGVVTQSNPDEWENMFGYKFKTKNDSEILWHQMKLYNNPFMNSTASVAGAFLSKEGSLSVFRNGARPLYVKQIENGLLFSSTQDILRRSFNDESRSFLLNPGFIFNINDGKMKSKKIIDIEDNCDKFYVGNKIK